MPDMSWAYSRMRELIEEKNKLEESHVVVGQAPRIDVSTVMAYRKDTEKILNTGSYAEQQQLLRNCVDKIKLAPDNLEVEITYKIPELLVNKVGAGRRTGW